MKYYIKALKLISKDRNIILIHLITLLTYGVLAADDAYQITFALDYTNISPSPLGIVGFISIIVESIIMIFFTSVRKIISIKRLLFICLIVLFIIFITKYLYYDNQKIIIVGNIMIGVFVGLFIPIAISIIDMHTDISIRNTVLNLYQASIKLGGAILGALTTAYIAFGNELPSIYLLHAILMIIPFILILSFKVEIKK